MSHRRGGRLALGVVTALLALTGCSSASSPDAERASAGNRPTPAGPSSFGRTTSGTTAPTTPSRVRVVVHVMPWRLPQPIAREAAIPVATDAVVAGGLAAGDQSTAAAYRLDLGSGRSTALTDLPVPVHDVGGAAVGGRPEILGGGNATEQSVVQVGRPDGGWRLASALPGARSDLAALSVGDRVFVVGGYDGTTPALGDVLVGTAGGAYRVFAHLRVPVRYAAMVRVGAAIWVFGGERSGVEVDPIQRIDLTTGLVRVVGRLPGPLGHATAVRLGSRILLIGGRTSPSRLTADMWWFQPSEPARLTRAGTLPFPLADSAAVPMAGAAYLIGGETPRLSDRVLRVSVQVDGR